MGMEKTCSVCRRPYTGWGNNAQPVNAGRCCDECNATVVLPARAGLVAASGRAWGVWCEVWGGVTGPRSAWLKADGVVQRFATEAEAQAEADRCLAGLSPHRKASFSYRPRQFE